MARITIVTKVRFLAAVAPVIWLAGAPYIAGALYLFGGAIGRLHERDLAAMRVAHAMQTSVYEIAWARSRRDAGEIIVDQRRAFDQWLQTARDLAESDDQRRILGTIAVQAAPLFEQLRVAAPGDEESDRKIRELQARINDLVAADDALILDLDAQSRRAARRLIAVVLVCGLGTPWLGFALVVRSSQALKNRLRSIRQGFDDLSASESAAIPGGGKSARNVDDALAQLGFPKRDPMLAE